MKVQFEDTGGRTQLGGIGGILSEMRDKLTDYFSAALNSIKKTKDQAKAMAEALQDGVDGADALESSVKRTASVAVKAAKRILAGFDEIQRLGSRTVAASSGSRASSGGSSGGSSAEAERVAALIAALTDRMKEAVTSLKGGYTALFDQFFAAVQAGFQELSGSERVVSGILTTIRADFNACWNGIWAALATTGARLNEDVVQPVATAASSLNARLQVTFDGVQLAAAGLFNGIAASALRCRETVAAAWMGIAAWFTTGVVQPMASQFARLWSTIYETSASGMERLKTLMTGLTVLAGDDVVRKIAQLFQALWESVATGASRAADGLKTVFTAAIQAVATTARNAWAGVKQAFSATLSSDLQSSLVSAFESALGELLRALNALLRTGFEGINAALRAIRNTEIAGARPFANLKTVPVPQVPYLAQGAVLPANKPFMAIVGDQAHGTNVEAPLGVIQEAVALVMEEQTDSILSKVDAAIGVQREILEAVLGIRIGDDVIGRAAARYDRKMAVARGGRL